MKPIDPTIIDSIELGTYANDGTGDDLRTAFVRVNNNFALLDSKAAINNGQNVGAGAGIFKLATGAKLHFKSLTSTDTSVTITGNTDTVNLAAKTRLSTDLTPTLSADLSLNGYAIKAINGGDIQSTVNSLSIPNLHFLVALLLESNSLNVDMGTFTIPSGSSTNGSTGYPLDMNGTLLDSAGFSVTPPVNQLNFGEF